MAPFDQRSLDLLSRQVVVASLLYYGLDAKSFLTDGEYDEATRILAERFDELEPIRKWQLGSAKAIQATGMKVKVTVAAASSAVAYLESIGETRKVVAKKKWRTPKGKPRFLLPDDFTWAS